MAKIPSKISRRKMLHAGTGLALGGTVADSASAQLTAPPKPSVYQALGLKHIINATGTVTNLGGSLMPPEVAAAWVEASKHFVNIVDLQNRVGERIAQLIGVEAAYVTTGASGAILLGTAAVVAGANPKFIAQLPDTTGMKNEVILQKAHHSCYDHQMTNVGARLVEVETAEEVRKAIGPRTAMMFFMNKEDRVGKIHRQEWLQLARHHRIPAFLDAAADVPPLDRLAGYCRMGFDMVAFSGGKAIRGPNDTGLLLGTKDLIHAASLHANPRCGTIGRMMKVSKEDTIAILFAIERFVKMDHKAEWAEFERRIDVIEKALAGIPSIRFERIVPHIANEVPHLVITWDEERLKITPAQITAQLMEGEAPIQIGRVSNTGDKGILISVLTLQAGEEQTVGERLRALLRGMGK